MEFQYDAGWLASPESRPLSLSLPITAPRVPHKGAVVEAYFDNLLPDSESIRRRLQERFHTDSRGAFDLLAAIGRDCVGAVQILPVDEAPSDIRRIEFQALGNEDVARELAGVTSPANLLARDADEFRISIAGVQEKTAFLRHHGRWCRPVGSTPTTHIFKLPLGLVGNRQADMRRPVSPSRLVASATAAWTAGSVPARDLSTSLTLTSTCGRRVIAPARSLSVLPVWATRARSMTAVSVPSPVVAWSDRITCPDCSPPSL
jgi:serine/threonine-protein kinase HipA